MTSWHSVEQGFIFSCGHFSEAPLLFFCTPRFKEPVNSKPTSPRIWCPSGKSPFPVLEAGSVPVVSLLRRDLDSQQGRPFPVKSGFGQLWLKSVLWICLPILPKVNGWMGMTACHPLSPLSDMDSEAGPRVALANRHLAILTGDSWSAAVLAAR
jgi:hypothetical protein